MTEPQYLDATLSDAAIRNGYLDLESRHSRFFPEDAFGDRSGDRKGMSVTLEFDGKSVETDIRMKSESTNSPRTRFYAWFKSLRAAPGDVIRMHRAGPRRYRLEHVSGRGSTGAPRSHGEPLRSASAVDTVEQAVRAPEAIGRTESEVPRHSGGDVAQGLVIADPWVDLILSGRKTWEIRGEPVGKRGPFAVLRKGTGTIAGVATLAGVRGPLSMDELRATHHLHAVPVERFGGEYRYENPYAWILEAPIRLPRPVPYRHPSGAVKWVNLDEAALAELQNVLADLRSH